MAQLPLFKDTDSYAEYMGGENTIKELTISHGGNHYIFHSGELIEFESSIVAPVVSFDNNHEETAFFSGAEQYIMHLLTHNPEKLTEKFTIWHQYHHRKRVEDHTNPSTGHLEIHLPLSVSEYTMVDSLIRSKAIIFFPPLAHSPFITRITEILRTYENIDETSSTNHPSSA